MEDVSLIGFIGGAIAIWMLIIGGGLLYRQGADSRQTQNDRRQLIVSQEMIDAGMSVLNDFREEFEDEKADEREQQNFVALIYMRMVRANQEGPYFMSDWNEWEED
jgi:hypothetical protein